MITKKISSISRKILKQYFLWLPDKIYLSSLFRLSVGYKMDFKNPLTYNQKLQWLKVYNRNPLYTQLVDKYEVKDFVIQKIGQQHVAKTIGVWDNVDQIDFSTLPNQFVLKTTHGGGNTGVVICKDKSSFDIASAKKKLSLSMKQEIYRYNREWPYKNVRKRIIAEEYLEDKQTGELRDYKFFCFDGAVKAMFLATDRSSGNVKFDYFDENFNHLEIVQQHPMSGLDFKKPVSFDNMKSIAEKLSAGIPHVRVDLYEVNGEVYFGEFTFFHHGGLVPFHPESWDFTWGDWISLPNKTISDN